MSRRRRRCPAPLCSGPQEGVLLKVLNRIRPWVNRLQNEAHAAKRCTIRTGLDDASDGYPSLRFSMDGDFSPTPARTGRGRPCR